MPEKNYLDGCCSSRKEMVSIYQGKRSLKWLRIAIGILLVLTSGCIRIPGENRTISNIGRFDIHRQNASCTETYLDPFVAEHIGTSRKTPSADLRTPALNADGFKLVSWNIFKGKKKGWAEDFQNFSQNADILILQEAYLTNRFRKMLTQGKYQWDMTVAFEYLQIQAGVLTAAKTASNFICSFQETEPITRIPKSVLITRYPMTDTNRQLLVANIHGVNFTMNNSAFKKQIDRLENILSAHRGPMIVSGDFNTWNKGRMSRVIILAKSLGLTTVRFEDNRRSRIFGYDVDHVYYRELEAEHAAIPIVSTSDHNPLSVVFKLVDETDFVH